MIIRLNVKFIKKFLARHDYTYDWIAERTGLSLSYIYKLMREINYPSPDCRKRLRYIFRTKWENLFIIEEEE